MKTVMCLAVALSLVVSSAPVSAQVAQSARHLLASRSVVPFVGYHVARRGEARGIDRSRGKANASGQQFPVPNTSGGYTTKKQFILAGILTAAILGPVYIVKYLCR